MLEGSSESLVSSGKIGWRYVFPIKQTREQQQKENRTTIFFAKQCLL